MPKVVVTHNVADVEKWLGFKSERAEAIAGLGGSNVVDHVAKDGSTTVAVSAEVSDVAAFEAALWHRRPRSPRSCRTTACSRP